MEIQIFEDNTIPLDLVVFCELMNSVCSEIKFVPINERFEIDDPQVNCPKSYGRFSKGIKNLKSQADLNYFLTNIPYDNNFFFEGHGNDLILSFSGWQNYTGLPISNGLAYFIASNIAFDYNIGEQHQENVGCLNDFWWDKTGVDLGMKSAHLCSECKSKTNFTDKKELIFNDIEQILDIVSNSSRRNKDILDQTLYKKGKRKFDIFLCHNSEDKPEIRNIKSTLQQNGVSTWMDEDQLQPGSYWQIELENQIGEISNVAVFVGENGFGPWQSQEMRAFLSEFVNRGCRVIPIILPTTKDVPELPIFLRQITWLDLRKEYESGIEKLIGVINSTKAHNKA